MSELPGGGPNNREPGVMTPEPTQGQTPVANIPGVKHNKRPALDGTPFVDLRPGGRVVRTRTDESGRAVRARAEAAERKRVNDALAANAKRLKSGVKLKDL